MRTKDYICAMNALHYIFFSYIITIYIAASRCFFRRIPLVAKWFLVNF
jgi:hypothetical protein